MRGSVEVHRLGDGAAGLMALHSTKMFRILARESANAHPRRRCCRDVRFALRLMRQTPAVSAVAMLSLALGIGANVAIFSLVNALMLKTLPIHEPERLVHPESAGDRARAPAAAPRSPTRSGSTSATIRTSSAACSRYGSARFNLNAGGEARPVVGPLRQRPLLRRARRRCRPRTHVHRRRRPAKRRTRPARWRC